MARILEKRMTERKMCGIEWKERQAVCLWRNTDAPTCNNCYSGRAIIVIYTECVFVALLSCMQCACSVLLSAACPAVWCFSNKQYDFEKKKLLTIKCMFWFSLQLCMKQTFLIRRKIQRDMIKNACRSSCEVPVILVSLFIKLEFSRQIF
jgi:hypothetical protein